MLAGSQPHVRVKVLAALERTPIDVSRALMASSFDHDPIAPLKRLLARSPALAVVSAMSRRHSLRLHAVVPELPEAVVENTSHWLMMDEPTELQPLLDRFLSTLR
jgi:hypothetical protein